MTVKERVARYLKEQGIEETSHDAAYNIIRSKSEKAYRILRTDPTTEQEVVDYFSTMADYHELIASAIGVSYIENIDFIYRKVGTKDVTMEAGCGSGIHLCFLARERPYQHFIGYDFVPKMLEKAQKRAGNMGLKNVEFRLASHRDAPEKISRKANMLITDGSILGLRSKNELKTVIGNFDKMIAPKGRYMNMGLASSAVWDTMKAFTSELGFEVESEDSVGWIDAVVFHRTV